MIYRNSRYTKTEVTQIDGVSVFKMRRRFEFSKANALVHEFKLGDRLDGLAMTYYKDPQLWWVFLEANTQYKSELDIPYGANLIVPSVNEVMKCLRY